MRGIQINNYFNNHITLNGKKINQESQPILHTARTRLNNPYPQDVDSQPESKILATKNHQVIPKKRTNTLAELKRKTKRSTSADRHKNAVSARKRDQVISHESQKQDEHLTNMSQKRLKPHSNKGGLGKRSKSTIIKTTNLQSHRVGPETSKKQPKKLVHNPTDQSMKTKTKRKKSTRTIQFSKELKKESRPNTARRQYIPIASKQVYSKKEKMGFKLEKGEYRKPQTQIKAPVTKRKGSKPVSARQKKPRKEKLIQQLKEKYENQTVLAGQLSNRLPSREQTVDHDFLSVMSSLEKVLTSVGSKQKLRKQLDLINQKLKQFRIDSAENEEEQEDESVKQVEQKEKQQKNDGYRSSQSESQRDERQQYLNQDIGLDNSNPLTHKRYNQFVFADGGIQSTANDWLQRRKQIDLLKQFKNQSTRMLQRVGLSNTPQKQILTPIQNEIYLDQKQESNICQMSGPISGISEDKKILDEGNEQQQIEEKQAPVFGRKILFISNESGMSSSSGGLSMREDKYPQGLKSPRFDQDQLLGIISLKEQFVSSKRDKMNELVRHMFEKQLVSPRSYQHQLKSLNKKFEDQNLAIESLRQQAQQMSAMLSQIQKDRQQIQGIDELIRNQQWEQAKQLVEIPPVIAEQQTAIQDQIKKPQTQNKDLKSWQRQEGWQLVRIQKQQDDKPAGIKQEEVEDNEFVDIAQMSTRTRRKAEARIDLDQECGGTEQSVQLQEQQIHCEQIIDYQDDKQEDQHDGCLIKLVQIEQNGINVNADANQNVFHIQCEQMGSKEFGASGIQKNISSISSQSERKGFTTNLYFIKQYCIALCQFVRDHDLFKSHFKRAISLPLQFDLLKLIADLNSDDVTSFFYSQRTNDSAIPQNVWNDFNSQYDSLKYNSHLTRTGQKYAFEKQQELIFLRMIFDVLNQSLDSERPGSQFGKALPWKGQAKHLKNLKQMSRPQEDNIEAYDLTFGVAIARIIQWGSCLCGFLPDTVELENTQIDQPYVNHIRQTRMAFLLEKMMAAEEPMMTNFQLQQTEVEYKLAQIIIEQIFCQAAKDIQQSIQSHS